MYNMRNINPDFQFQPGDVVSVLITSIPSQGPQKMTLVRVSPNGMYFRDEDDNGRIVFFGHATGIVVAEIIEGEG